MSYPPPAERIRAVTFDVGDTLLSAAPSVGHIYSGVCARSGVELDPERCNGVFEEVWKRRAVTGAAGGDRFSAASRGEEGYWEDLVAEVMAACGVESHRVPPIAAFRAAFASPESWRVYDEVPAILASLRGSGYELAVLSNWDSQLPLLLRRLGLHQHFTKIFVSATAGVEKPAGRFFEMAAGRMGASPGEVLHIGDRLREDYFGAVQAGMSALWLDRRGNGTGREIGVDPAHVIRSLSGVVRWLESDRSGPSLRPGRPPAAPA